MSSNLEKIDRAVVCAAGGAFLGGLLLQVPGALIGAGLGVGYALLTGNDDSEFLARRAISDAYISGNQAKIESRRDDRKEEFIQWVANRFGLLGKDARAIVDKCDLLCEQYDLEWGDLWKKKKQQRHYARRILSPV